MCLELELPIYDGGEIPVQVQMELNWFMPEELGEHFIPLTVEQLTSFVYLKILIILLKQQDSQDRVKYGVLSEFGSLHTNLLQYNVPCAVCYISTRTSVLMIPAKTQCPSSWTREYYGYLTAEHDSYHRSSYECVDSNPEAIPGSSSHLNGALFYYVGGTCNGLDCPPYESSRILSCTVCTK